MSGGGDRFARHGLWALLSGAALAVSVLLPAPAWPVIPCLFQRALHRPCPFCGLTRAVRAAGQGQWAESCHGAPLGSVLFLALAGFFLWHSVGWLSGRSPRLPFAGRSGWRWGLGTLVLAVLANWLYRWTMGFDRT